MDTYVVPAPRTVTLRVALTVGAAALAGAFGSGYFVSEAFEGSAQQAGSASGAASYHAVSHALRESLVLKNRAAVGGKAADVRYRRVMAP
jgi:F0F1-type ATP synthase membrane subunit c/vacuolar-type H+-ATPase subunit K